jgi:hypothetical protein
MALTFSNKSQLLYNGGPRLSDNSGAGNFSQRFPDHARPIQHMPDAPGPYGSGNWKIYERDYDGGTKPAVFGFKHRDQIWRRTPKRDFYTGATEWQTDGVISDAVMFSS